MTTNSCAHPKIESILPTEGEVNVLGGVVTEGKKLVYACTQKCGYMETIKFTEFGRTDLSQYTYIKP